MRHGTQAFVIEITPTPYNPGKGPIWNRPFEISKLEGIGLRWELAVDLTNVLRRRV